MRRHAKTILLLAVIVVILILAAYLDYSNQLWTDAPDAATVLAEINAPENEARETDAAKDDAQDTTNLGLTVFNICMVVFAITIGGVIITMVKAYWEDE